MGDLREQVKKIRRDYNSAELSELEVPKNPIEFFKQWISDAMTAEIDEPNAFTLSTFGNDFPDSRVVLLRDLKEDGFSFFTNYTSQKAKEIETNPNVAVNFFWVELHRQIRIKARVGKLSSEDSDEYFNSRPRESQIGAWASDQSEVLESRKELEDKLSHFEEKFKDCKVPRPEFWGGYLLKPVYFEFWQGRPSRLHDRITYEMVEKDWKIKRLSP